MHRIPTVKSPNLVHIIHFLLRKRKWKLKALKKRSQNLLIHVPKTQALIHSQTLMRVLLKKSIVLHGPRVPSNTLVQHSRCVTSALNPPAFTYDQGHHPSPWTSTWHRTLIYTCSQALPPNKSSWNPNMLWFGLEQVAQTNIWSCVRLAYFLHATD